MVILRNPSMRVRLLATKVVTLGPTLLRLKDPLMRVRTLIDVVLTLHVRVVQLAELPLGLVDIQHCCEMPPAEKTFVGTLSEAALLYIEMRPWTVCNEGTERNVNMELL